jgi:poly(3-hydroxybutyrate) depolymerase
MRNGVFLAAIALLAPAAAAAESGKTTKDKIPWKGRERTYFLHLPQGTASDQKLPLVLTLHGSGQDPGSLVSKWKDLGDKEKIILVGPKATEPARWTVPADGPLFLHDLVEAVKARYSVDGRRVYLFGHSAGAVFALEMAALESEYFAAVAVHAGAIRPAYVKILDYATRKIPSLILIGTRDAFFPLDLVRATRDALKERGFPVEYVEMSGHTHDYRDSAKEINQKAWDFFSKNALTSDPKYTAH